MIKKITLEPARIGCPSISGTMKGIIISIQGVTKVDIHYEDRSLDITFDDAITSIEEIIKKIGQETGLAFRERK